MLVTAMFQSEIVGFIANEIMNDESVVLYTDDKENYCEHVYALSDGLRIAVRTSAIFPFRLLDLSSIHISFTFEPTGVRVKKVTRPLIT